MAGWPTGRGASCSRTGRSSSGSASGKSEDTDPDWAFTLIRESDEESQVTVERDSIAYLGHQVVTGDPVVPGPYVQVRLFGIVREFRPPEPDPDNGHVYRRLMTAAPQAAGLLAWGPPGDLQSRAVVSETPKSRIRRTGSAVCRASSRMRSWRSRIAMIPAGTGASCQNARPPAGGPHQRPEALA
jgi:hypothetical protein